MSQHKKIGRHSINPDRKLSFVVLKRTPNLHRHGSSHIVGTRCTVEAVIDVRNRGVKHYQPENLLDMCRVVRNGFPCVAAVEAEIIRGRFAEEIASDVRLLQRHFHPLQSRGREIAAGGVAHIQTDEFAGKYEIFQQV